MKWIVIIAIILVGLYFTFKQAENEDIPKAIYCVLGTILIGLATNFIYDAVKLLISDPDSSSAIEIIQKEEESPADSPTTSAHEGSTPYETIAEETSSSEEDPKQEEQHISQTSPETTSIPATTEMPTRSSTIPATTEMPTRSSMISVITDVTNMRSFQGQIKEKAQVDRYRYTTSVSGTYRFDTDLSSGGEVRVRVSGENGKSIDHGSKGLTIDLEAGKTYIVSVEYINGPCDYSVNIGVPMEMHDITGFSTVLGSITYPDQKDRYLYTASISGTYRFEVELDAAAEVRIRISGENGKNIDYGSNALSIDLEAEKTYILSVEYRNGPCDYDLILGVPQAVQDITGIPSVSGDMVYRDQKDRYSYTASTSGTYRFDTDLSSGGEVRVRLSGENGKSISYDTNGLTVDLTAGETYILSIEYRNAPCGYTLSVGVPMEPQDITENDSIYGSITYRDQKDRYLYIAPYTGIYYFKTEVSSDADVRVRVSGENGRSLNNNVNEVRIELEEGKLYILSIEYKNGFCEYEVYIELP